MAQHGANEEVLQAQGSQLVTSKASFFVGPVQHHLGIEGTLTYGLIVWTLFELGRSIQFLYSYPSKAARFRGGIVVDPLLCGTFRVLPPAASSLALASLSNSSTIAASRHRDAPNIATLRADSGTRSTPEDPDLVIRYQIYHHALPSGQVLMAFLMAQTYFLEHEKLDRNVNMLALSTDARIRLQVKQVEEGAGTDLLTWDQARIAVRTVWREVVMGYSFDALRFVGEARWESVSFTIERKGVKIGTGSLGW